MRSTAVVGSIEAETNNNLNMNADKRRWNLLNDKLRERGKR